MKQMSGNPKITSLLLAVVAIFLNLFQPGLSTAKGFTSPELTTQIGITLAQNDQDNTSGEPELDDVLPPSFPTQEEVPVQSGRSPVQPLAQASANCFSIQVRAPPFNLV